MAVSPETVGDINHEQGQIRRIRDARGGDIHEVFQAPVLFLPIRRTKSPKAEFPGGRELSVDGTFSPGRLVAMLSANQLQLGRGGCHESATGATGPGGSRAK